MFTELTAKGFKSWRDLHACKLGPITGLFGSNSSGKTSLLQLLLLLQQTTESTDRSQPLDFGDSRSHVQLGSFSDVQFKGGDGEVEIGVSWKRDRPLTISDPDTADELLFQATALEFITRLSPRKRTGVPVVQFFRYLADEHVVEMTRESGQGDPYQISATVNGNRHYLRRQRGRPWPLPSPNKCYGFPDQVFAVFQNAGFVADLELELEQQFTRLFYLAARGESPSFQGST